MFRKRAWEDVGGFPLKSPFYGQETALIWKAMQVGWRTAIVLDCWVKHLGSASALAAQERGGIQLPRRAIKRCKMVSEI